MLFQTGRLIDQDMTLTCSPSDGSADFVGNDALAQALASLEKYEITGTVTIQLADGVYGAGTPLSQITLTHRNTSNIVIKGNDQPAITFDISSATTSPSVTNSTMSVPAGAYTAGDFYPGGNYEKFVAYVVGSTGNDGAYRIDGASTDNGDILLQMEPGSIKSTIKDGTLYLLPANRCQMVFNGTSEGIRQNCPGDIAISGLFLYGNNGQHGLTVNGSGYNATLSRCVFASWDVGVMSTRLAYVNAAPQSYENSCVVVNSGHGFFCHTGAAIHANRCIVSGALVGYRTTDRGVIRASAAIVSRNTNGLFASGGIINAASARAVNNGVAARAEIGGHIITIDIYLDGNTADYNPAGTPPIEGPNGEWII